MTRGDRPQGSLDRPVSEEAPRIAIVVPDGLKASPQKSVALAEPSFAFRAVLDRVVVAHRTRRILLAPGNSFGSGEFEQEVAARYLRARGVADITVAPSPSGRYVDTRGNAIHLRRYLLERGAWPSPAAILVVARPHAKRAAYCFRAEGFALPFVDAVRYAIPADEPVIYRQWYYRHPLWHVAYEGGALVRDLLYGRSRLNLRD
jgi:uncharacterized SAM-binding protein YcdF (DUF218 family)